MSRSSLHTRILSKLADSLLQDPQDTSAIDRLIAKCPVLPETRSPLDSTTIAPRAAKDVPLGRMTLRKQQSLAALIKYTLASGPEQQRAMLPRLLDYLRHLPAYEWDGLIAYHDPVLPDIVSFQLVSGLVCLANQHADLHLQVVTVLKAYLAHICEQWEDDAHLDDEYLVCFVFPSMMGISRALQLSPYMHMTEQFDRIFVYSQQKLLKETTLRNVRLVITRSVADASPLSLRRRILAKYWDQGTPLTPNRWIYDALVLMRNTLASYLSCVEPTVDQLDAQVWSAPDKIPKKLHLTHEFEHIWAKLLPHQPPKGANHANHTSITSDTPPSPTNGSARCSLESPENKRNLRALYVACMDYYQDIVDARQAHGAASTSESFYMTEIMGLTLHVAALASVCLHQVDDLLVQHMIDCLLNNCDEQDSSWIHVAALDAALIVAINFQHLTARMTEIICQFLATPSDSFDLETVSNGSTITIRQFAIIRLAQCVQTTPTDELPQAAISILYALLNEITRFGEGPTMQSLAAVVNQSGGSGSGSGSGSAYMGQHKMTDLNEKQKRQVCVNVLSAIIGVAVHLKDEGIIAQAFSMLMLQRKSYSIPTTASLISSLVDLGLVASISMFEEILTVLSSYNREFLVVEDQQIWHAISSTQLSLAQRLCSRPDLYLIYLMSLLTLFLENGSKIQRLEGHPTLTHGVDIPLGTRLGSLLGVLQALLMHDDFNPQDNPPSEMLVSLFRNVWFLCVMFGFVSDAMWLREWQEALLVLAQKTPVLLVETATDYLESDLEYNSVLRGGHASPAVLQHLQGMLTDILPARTSEIRALSYAQVVFLLTVYHVESRRSMMGNTSFILRYFMNDSLLVRGPMNSCLDAILDLVTADYIRVSSLKAREQALNDDITLQIHDFLPLCCHRLDKVHSLALRSTDRIVRAFPQVFAQKSLVCKLLELVQLLWRSCAAEYRDQYNPIYHFTSTRANVTLELSDDYDERQRLCGQFSDYATKWLLLSMDCCPLEVTGILQDYLGDTEHSDMMFESAHLGRTIALQVGKTAPTDPLAVAFGPSIAGIHIDSSSDFAKGFTSKMYYAGGVQAIDKYTSAERAGRGPYDYIAQRMVSLLDDLKAKKHVHVRHIQQTLLQAAAFIIAQQKVHPDLVRDLVRIPVYAFTPEALRMGTNVWNWVIVERPDQQERLMLEMLAAWSWAQSHRKGLFSPVINIQDPFTVKMTYQPSDGETLKARGKAATLLFSPHEIWIRFLTSHFFAIRHKSKHMVNLMTILLSRSFENAHLMSTHPLSRLPRFQMVYLGLVILTSAQLEACAEYQLRSLVYDMAFNWFELTPSWRYGSWKSLALYELNTLIKVYRMVQKDTPNLNHLISSYIQPGMSDSLRMFSADKTKDGVLQDHEMAKQLLLLLLENEIYRINVWCNPLDEYGAEDDRILHNLSPNTIGKTLTTNDAWKTVIRYAWRRNVRMAIQMAERFKQCTVVTQELNNLIANNTLDVLHVPEALVLLFGDGIQPTAKLDLKYLKYWAPVPAITAANYFLPAYGNQPMVLQYAMRSLEYYSVDIVFFYVPQIVQALRHDEFGYVERYIMKAGQVSSLFAHQIIWNMQANYYVDADKGCERPDPMKPTLERIIQRLVDSFDGDDRQFYEREFKFFGEITAISGYLKEYIRFGQNEKKPMQKKRLDEELAKIKVDVGVYLPSNPDGHVIDISRTSGRPLQSHAKAPFMATFLIEKPRETDSAIQLLRTTSNVSLSSGESHESEQDIKKSGSTADGEDEDDALSYRLWQGAIFKVGDDCRQDVLALQLIAVFKNIFASVGLDLYVYPYRVVATEPGRGVIDVIPQSISRDQLGREKVNNMYDYFIAKYGSPHTVHFQRARIHFIQSLAAYSVISYLLQIKDRHNGNIMLDDDGHIVHIDFGFIFDIAPGGGILEVSPFKLTTEMVQIMGGDAQHQAFRQFSELVVKAYLAARPHAEQIMQLVTLMLESGLPCFKGDTIRRMRARFQTDKIERVAAAFMLQRIKDSYENQRTVMYDYFQKVTNGIPY